MNCTPFVIQYTILSDKWGAVYICLNIPLFSGSFFGDQGYEFAVGGLIALIEEIDTEELVGGVEPPAVPGDFDGISLESPETALNRAFSCDFRTLITVKPGHLLGAAAYASIIKYVYRGFG